MDVLSPQFILLDRQIIDRITLARGFPDCRRRPFMLNCYLLDRALRPGAPPMSVTIEPAAQSKTASENVAKAILPQAFLGDHPSSAAAATYLNDSSTRNLVQFFNAKGLAALKDEDRREQWYDDWLAYQARHNLYASLLAPRQYSKQGGELNLLRLTRFFEVFGYCSPAHGYSLQVTFLGLFSILMGTNSALKEEAVAKLEQGGLFAFGISERNHGSDLLANEFVIEETGPGKFTANGVKNYIGNSNCASMISILAHLKRPQTNGRRQRPTLALVVLRPEESKGFQDLRKIHTLGVRAGFVGEFSVKNHQLTSADLIAEGRQAWDAVFGTVALGKFLLGFGQIGICEHALEEADTYLRSRILYGKQAIENESSQIRHGRSLRAPHRNEALRLPRARLRPNRQRR